MEHERTPRPLPRVVAALDRLADAPTETLAERAVLLASARWANERGEIWVASEKWARLAGVHPRTLRDALRNLEARGVVVRTVASKGGAKRTSRYVVPILANPAPTPGLERDGTRPLTTINPARDTRKPGPYARQSCMNVQGTNTGGTFIPRNPTDDDLAVVYGRVPR